MKILMVCLGNICRSPLAEGIMKHHVREAGLDWEVDSAGTSGWHNGELPDQRSILVARKNGLDITDQRSRQIQVRDLDDFDTIFVMDRQNQKDVLGQARTDEQRGKVRLLLEELNGFYTSEVPDPYYDGSFDRVYDMIDQACATYVRNHRSPVASS